jgi:putative ABC transport system permease protein
MACYTCPKDMSLRHILRGPMMRPGFTAIVVLTLALGIGANTAIFSLVYAILLRPFPYPEPDRLVRIETRLSRTAGATRGASVYDFDDWRKQQTSFEDIAAYISFSNNLESPAGAQSVGMTMATPSLFSVLGVRPIFGRTFTEEENQSGGDVYKAVLSESLWQQTFGGDPHILGRTIQLRGATYTVVGVMPEFCRYPDRTDVWVPLQARYAGYKDQWWRRREIRIHNVLGRLKPRVSAAQGQANLQSVADGLGRIYPVTNDGVQIHITPLREVETGKLRPFLVLVGGAVLMVLLICCVNVANLLLARSVAREREIAVRAALGAGRWHIVRQLLGESLFLGLTAGVLGAGVALVGVKGLMALIPVSLPPWMHIEVEWNALLFNFAIALISALVFGLMPALQLSRVDVIVSLKEGTRGSSAGGRAARNLRDGLVIAEVALSLVLLTGASLMMRSFVHLRNTDAGMDRQHLLTAQVGRFLTGMTNDQLAMAFAADYRRLMGRVEQMPGVISVGGGDDFPYQSHGEERNRGEVYLRGQDERERKENAAVEGTQVTPGYFNVLGIPILEGRDFTEADDISHPRTVIISRRAAQRLFAGRQAIGQQVTWGKPGPDTPWTTVIGVVGDTRWHATERQPGFEFYYSYRQFATLPFHLVLRTHGDPAGLEAAVREMVREVNPALAIKQIRTMDLVVTEALWEQRLWGVLFLAFALLALALAAIGIYGVMSYLVSQRTREIGIRMALGSSQKGVLALVAGRGAVLIAGGVVLGSGGAFVLAQAMRSLIYGAGPDVSGFAAAVAVLAAVALFACCVPAWRASRVDPLTALRQD